jgi:WhiB family transcriptional regulator, redox-sensing transcriptional regulator
MNPLEQAYTQAIHLVDRTDRLDHRPSKGEAIVTSTVGLLDESSAADVFAELGSDGSAPIWASLPDLPCRVEDADLWFAEKPTELEQAKAFCRTCPVRLTCLAGAIARREPWGVWGGEIFERGEVIARKRPRGRPRKDQGVAA